MIQQYFSGQFEEIEEKRKSGMEWLSAEKAVLDLTHAEIGSKVAERWAFPPNLIDVIGHHHDCSWEINPIFGKIIHYADKFTFGEMNFSTLLESFSKEGMNCRTVALRACRENVGVPPSGDRQRGDFPGLPAEAGTPTTSAGI